jgi:4-hydroxybenzoate polyprenyltransferase
VATAGARTILVDLDSLLTGSSLTAECLVAALRRRPLLAFGLPFWALRGKPVLRRRLAEAADLDPAELPYRADGLELLETSRAAGDRIVLVADSDPALTRQVARCLGVDDVEPRHAAGATARPNARAIVRALRPYQWLKNTLVFVPFLLAHDVADARRWISAALLFLAFSFCASACYVVNDILDRPQDRLHPRRRLRPIAAGDVPLATALWLPLPLAAAAGLCCALLPPACAIAAAAYLATAIFYSGFAKNLVMADVLLLALLYLLRLMAGSAATGNVVSHWLLAFAVALFLSLALSKRVSELIAWGAADLDRAPGRKYRAADVPVLEMMAVASGFLACLIMVFYIQSPEILRLYRRPEYLWVGVVALLYWLGRLFIYSHRGECPDDPLLFAVQDRTTLAVLAVAATFALLAV